jgi:tripartite-type tricarboxylate transporter receptor subunit TctC
MHRRTALSLFGSLALGFNAAAQSFPSKPIQIVVPTSPSGVADIVGRAYADQLSKIFGQPVAVMNKPGGGTIIGTQSVATALPDGYTILSANSAHSINQLVQANLPFDPLKDFAGIALVADAPAVAVATNELGIKTLKELIAYGKAKPKQLNYASAGVGSATHLAGAHFAAKAGIEITHVPYKNYSDANLDLVSGRVHLLFAPAGFLVGLVKDNRVTVLGVSSPEDLKQPFEAPSAAKAGVDWEYGTWYGFLAPAKTPRPVLEQLARAISQASADPQLRASLEAQGIRPKNLTLQAFDNAMRNEVERLRPLVSSSDVKSN